MRRRHFRDMFMMDHDTGQMTKVADLPTRDIQDAFRRGVNTVGTLAQNDVFERLRIELLIRELGL